MSAAGHAVYEPGSLTEARDLMRLAAHERSVVAFEGGGTALDFGYPPERLDCTIRTTGMNRIVDHAATDMTLTVEAGVTLARVQTTLAASGQRLALDPPLADEATVGGVLAVDAYGPLRTRFGSARDLTLGVRLVRADGALVRGGGKVVKNVAGFDLPKLAIGSLGTLGLIVEATFRLHPLPAERRDASFGDLAARDVRDLCRATAAAQVEPSSFVAARTPDGRYAAALRFEGSARGCDEQVAALTRSFARPLLGDDGTLRVEKQGAAARASGGVRIRLAHRPADLADVDGAALVPIAAALVDGACVAYPALGIAFCSGAAPDEERLIVALDVARAALERRGGLLVVERAPESVRARFDVFGALPASLELMKNVKRRFDPERRLNPGRFLGRL